MARYQNIEEQMATMNIDEEENEDFVFEGDVEEEVNKYEMCLVGRFLTEKNINTKAMKTKMADIWKPMMGINIKELEQGIYLFQFFHKEDLMWVQSGGPWSFDNTMLCLDIIPPGEDPLKVDLWFLNIWIQVHDLPAGFMSEKVGKQLGNFFGEFLLYDVKNDTSIWRECMRVKIRIDVRKPLKRKKRITRKNGQDFVVTCKYERLGDFCFSCGLVSHTERFCRKNLDNREGGGSKEWGVWLRAPPRRVAGQSSSKWLREEGDTNWVERIERENRKARFTGANSGSQDNGGVIRSDFRDIVSTQVTESSTKKDKQVLSIIPRNLPISNYSIGPEGEEFVGLNMEGRKRSRTGHETQKSMDTDGVLQLTGFTATDNALFVANLSQKDCEASNQTNMAELAKQASQFQ